MKNTRKQKKAVNLSNCDQTNQFSRLTTSWTIWTFAIAIKHWVPWRQEFLSHGNSRLTSSQLKFPFKKLYIVPLIYRIALKLAWYTLNLEIFRNCCISKIIFKIQDPIYEVFFVWYPIKVCYIIKIKNMYVQLWAQSVTCKSLLSSWSLLAFRVR